MKRRPDIEIADIFKQYYGEYRNKYHVSEHIGKVVDAVISCRTASLGGHVEICEECGHTQISYNSCRNRHCPKCQFVKKEKWALDKNIDVLPVEYFHVVFTVPDRLDLLMHRNGSKLYGLLMRCAGKTITELGAGSPVSRWPNRGDLRAPYMGAEVGSAPACARHSPGRGS